MKTLEDLEQLFECQRNFANIKSIEGELPETDESDVVEPIDDWIRENIDPTYGIEEK